MMRKLSFVLLINTDSLMYERQTEDFYKDISPDVSEMFDTSNFPKDRPSGIEVGVNKKVIGISSKMRLEESRSQSLLVQDLKTMHI